MGACPDHEISAPPPKLKKLRKKEEAAKAIASPKMIWMRRRNPPAVSPNASVRPVTRMMITATILATGRWTDSSTRWSGWRSEEPLVGKGGVRKGRYGGRADH